MKLTQKRLTEPDNLRLIRVLHRNFWGAKPFKVSIWLYEDNSFRCESPVNLTDQEIRSIDWTINTYGYEVTYKDGVQGGTWKRSENDYDEPNPFEHLINDNSV